METKHREMSDSYVDREGLLCNGPFRVLCVVEYLGYLGFVTTSNEPTDA